MRSAIARKILVLFLVLLTASAVTITSVDPGVSETLVARNTKKKPGLFERLFGPRDNNNKPPPLFKRPAPTKKKRKTPARTKAPEPAVAAVPVVPKDENARKILVVGDFVADGIGWGLDQALASETKLAVVDRSNLASGFVRVDYYDWNKELLGILNEENPDVVVVAIGGNDRQQMRDGNQRIQFRSEEWQRTYTHRIDGLVDTLRVYGRPFFWVSAPPMRTDTASGDMTYLNSLYAPRVGAGGGYFIDVWNGFTNANGQYVATGPDIDGQVRSLRTSDGINFTRAGKLKLSYYVEREIRRQTGIGAGAVDLLASTSQTSTIEIGPDGTKRMVGPVISLSDPLPGASGDLAGDPAPIVYDVSTNMVLDAPPPPKPDEERPLFRLVVKGEAPDAAAGRVDDFTWPPAQRDTQTFVEPGTPSSANAARLKTIAAQKAILTPLLPDASATPAAD